MGKLDELRRTAGANVKDSTGADRGQAVPAAAGPPARWRGVERTRDAAMIPREMIVRDEDQPRTEFDPEELGRLADSLRNRGQLQPIRVRWDEGRGAYVILMGERRWRAAQLAGLERLACIIHEDELGADERLALQLVENCLRSDLTAMEQARAYRRLMDAKGWTTRELAHELNIAQSSVSKALALLELPEAVQEQVDQGALAPHTAYEVSKLPTEDQPTVAAVAVEQKMTRQEVAEFVRARRAQRPAPAPKPEPVAFDLGAVVVKVIWKKADGPDVIRALRQAMKLAQERERGGEAA